MRCEEFRASYLTGDTGEDERRHLDGCASCRSELNRLAAGRELLSDAAVWEEPSPPLSAQVVALVAGASQPGGRRRRLRWGLVASAAVVMIVVVGLAMSIRQQAPDWQVPIGGTALAPAAEGTVSGWNVESGTRIALEIEGLARAPEGSVYELWLTRDQVHVSAGTFTEADGAQLWAGVARRDFPRLWITIEPLDDDESPTGITVMDTRS